MWKFGFIMPNIGLNDSIESEHLLIAPISDDRVDSIASLKPIYRKYLNSFTDQFGRKHFPSVLLIQQKFIESVNSLEAITSFRNLWAITQLTYGWQHAIGNVNVFHTLYSEFFNFYPIGISKDDKYLITYSPAILGVDDIDDFEGQSDPSINFLKLPESVPDRFLFNDLISCWEENFVHRNTKKRKISLLFRLLEVAMHAMQMPFVNQTSQHDYGVRISLWVSAIEVLTHPLKGHVNRNHVLEILGRINWNYPSLHKKYYANSKQQRQLTLPQKLYFDLYNTRNSYLHGNEVKLKNLFPFQNKKLSPLTAYAPILYRLLLEEFLKNTLNNFYAEKTRKSFQTLYKRALLHVKETN